MNPSEKQARRIDHFDWFRLALRFKGSVLPAILPQTLFCFIFGIVITILYRIGVPVAVPMLVAFVPNIALGLLLVFRTNTAYERFWEGRKWWGSLVNSTRNLARQIWVVIGEKDPQDRVHKIGALKLLVAFAITMKLHLRHHSLDVDPDLELLLLPSQYDKLKTMNHPPLEVALWIGDYLQLQYQRGCLDVYQLTAMQALLNNLVDALGACERILKTPLPVAYSTHLRQLVILYALSLPFQLVESLSWATGLVVGIFSFTILGIEEIALEIENPFGTDPNDLPLDSICKTMLRNIEDLITISTQANSLSYYDPGDPL